MRPGPQGDTVGSIIAGVLAGWPSTHEPLMRPWFPEQARQTGPCAVEFYLDGREAEPFDAGRPEPSCYQGRVQVFTRGPAWRVEDREGGGALEIAPDGARIRGWADPGRGPRSNASLMLFVALTLALRRRGQLHLHAGAVVGARGSVLVVGDAGAGKTTTVMLLGRLGWSVASDDTTFLGRDGLAHGLLRAFHVGRATRREFGSGIEWGQRHPVADKRDLPATALFEVHRGAMPPLRGVVLPAVTQGPTALVPVPGARALETAVANSGLLIAAHPEHDRWCLPALAAAVTSAPAFELRLGPDMSESVASRVLAPLS